MRFTGKPENSGQSDPTWLRALHTKVKTPKDPSYNPPFQPTGILRLPPPPIPNRHNLCRWHFNHKPTQKCRHGQTASSTIPWHTLPLVLLWRRLRLWDYPPWEQPLESSWGSRKPLRVSWNRVPKRSPWRPTATAFLRPKWRKFPGIGFGHLG